MQKFPFLLGGHLLYTPAHRLNQLGYIPAIPSKPFNKNLEGGQPFWDHGSIVGKPDK
jgi:hypothetical protein